MDKIEVIKKEAIEALAKAPNLGALRDLERKYLGSQGLISILFKDVKKLPKAGRSSFGAKINDLRDLFLQNLEERKKVLFQAKTEDSPREEWFDVTAPGKKVLRGHLHPITKIVREVLSIFASLGFEVVLGPDIETEWYNFDALNIPKDHPARDMWDTFWLQTRNYADGTQNDAEIFPRKSASSPRRSALLLRTHTSPVQIRYMEKHQPPFRIIVPGKIFRHEATDASHDIEFNQLEGLMVGRDVNVSHFKDIIQTFFQKLFKKDIKIRTRPSFYPFVEPGFDVDISCGQCHGKGCSVCGQDGWLELAGAGMVHPNVFKNAGLNPKEWQGFAFGFGIERLAMMKYKIPDIRLFHSDDLRFLEQF